MSLLSLPELELLRSYAGILYLLLALFVAILVSKVYIHISRTFLRKILKKIEFGTELVDGAEKPIAAIIFLAIFSLGIAQVKEIAELGGKAAFFLLALAGAVLISHIFDILTRRVTLRFLSIAEVKRYSGMIFFIGSSIKILVFVVAVAFVLAGFGFDVFALVAGLGIVGLVIGFAAGEIIKDVLSGIFLLLKKPFVVGDLVRIGSQKGAIEEIGLFSTILRGEDGQLIIISNNTVRTSIIENLTTLRKLPIEKPPKFVIETVMLSFPLTAKARNIERFAKSVRDSIARLKTCSDPEIKTELLQDRIQVSISYKILDVARKEKVKHRVNMRIKRAVENFELIAH